MLNPALPAYGKSILWHHLYGAGSGLAIAEATYQHDGLVLVVTEDQQQLQTLLPEIKYFRTSNNIFEVNEFPSWECLPYDLFSPHQDIVSERLRILAWLCSTAKHGLVLVNSANLMQRLPPTSYVNEHSFVLSCGDTIDINNLRKQLVDSSYYAVNQVMMPGEFAIRGGVIDIFPSGETQPFRLDLFGDLIDTIRYFDPDTQRSTDTTKQIALLPAREFPMIESGIQQFRQAFRHHIVGDPHQQTVYREVSQGHAPPGIEFFFPLFFNHTASLFDYLPTNTLIICIGDCNQVAMSFWAEIKDHYTNTGVDPQRRLLPPEKLYLNPTEFQHQIEQHTRTYIEIVPTKKTAWHAPCKHPGQFPVDPRSDIPYQLLINHLLAVNHPTLLTVETAGRREALEEVLTHHGIQLTRINNFSACSELINAPIGIGLAQLERGLHLQEPQFELITEAQLYGDKVYQRRRRRNQKSQDPEAIIRSLSELKIGDPVVHTNHGVGRYGGLQTLEIEAHQTEFLTVIYQNSDKLYVPILDLNLISRFVGGSPELAPLHRLGAEQWEKSKKKAQRKAYDVATELLEMEAFRKARVGISFTLPQYEYEKFIARFPFEVTADQDRAITEVINALKSPEPMDRLICGDVGFGKTEVALRAAFIAVHNKKQVALLVPTTLLAQQHYQTFLDRFSDTAISIELLSRFLNKKQANQLIAKMKEGYPDIVIGTHRLLQKDIQFGNLGLLIIDEEHRFGVRQKEQIKKLRSQIDLLTLTATPIPRTLNFTLAGMRDISIIATPPESRLSIKTFVREYNHGVIREACLREIRRGGQVYYLHNEIRSIQNIAHELTELMPEAKIEIGHGQMSELKLERVMQDFYHRRFNILICTTIIESGIDIPTANTIIVNRADRFGLAQLHQLRGRVGRSHHQAYAYLMIPGRKLITTDAQKRLDVIESMEDLGAGFALATHDLEIRGAGELLGETQSGLIDDVGFNLYIEYLNRAVKSIKDGKWSNKKNIPTKAPQVEVDLHLPVLFPADYLPDTHTRLVMYKRIAATQNNVELEELQIETIDRFGLLPQPAKNLFRVTAIRQQAEQIGINRLEISPTGGIIKFNSAPAIDVTTLLLFLEQNPHTWKLDSTGSLLILGHHDDTEQRLLLIEQLLEILTQTLD